MSSVSVAKATNVRLISARLLPKSRNSDLPVPMLTRHWIPDEASFQSVLASARTDSTGLFRPVAPSTNSWKPMRIGSKKVDAAEVARAASHIFTPAVDKPSTESAVV